MPPGPRGHARDALDDNAEEACSLAIEPGAFRGTPPDSSESEAEVHSAADDGQEDAEDQEGDSHTSSSSSLADSDSIDSSDSWDSSVSGTSGCESSDADSEPLTEASTSIDSGVSESSASPLKPVQMQPGILDQLMGKKWGGTAGEMGAGHTPGLWPGIVTISSSAGQARPFNSTPTVKPEGAWQSQASGLPSELRDSKAGHTPPRPVSIIRLGAARAKPAGSPVITANGSWLHQLVQHALPCWCGRKRSRAEVCEL